MLLLMLSVPSYANFSPKNNIDFLYVPTGYVATESGYWANEQTGRTLLTALRTYSGERDHWKGAYGELKEEHSNYIAKSEELIDQLQQRIDAERKGWKKEVMKAKAPGFGFFAGPCYTSKGPVEIAGGFGIVWKLW